MVVRNTALKISILLVFLSSCSFALTLRESINFAIQNNPSVIAAQKKVNSANAKLGQAVGTLLPTLKVDANYGRNYTQPSVTQITIGGVTQTLTFGINDIAKSKGITTSLTQPIFVGPLYPAISIAQKSEESAKEELRKAKLDTAYNAVQAYLGVLKSRKIEKVAEQSREMAQSHVNQIQSMLQAGVSTRADLLRSEVTLANSEVAVTQTKNAIEIAKDTLNNVLGIPLETKLAIVEEEFSGKVANLPSYEDILRMTFENRPEWRQFILSEKIAEDSVSVAKTGYLPTVFLSAQSGDRITEYPTFNSDASSWSVAGLASWTFFDGFATVNKIREANANLEAQKANEDQLRNAISLDVRNTYLGLTSMLETIASTKKAVDSAEENYKVSTLRYASGVGTNLDILDAQNSLTQSSVNYLNAIFDVEIAKAKLNKSIGKEIIK